MLLTSETFARYHRMGFSPRPVRGKIPDQDLAVSYYFDNVQYVFNDYGAYEETGDIEDMNLCIVNLDYIINSERHEKVKAVLEHVQKQLQVPVWCEVAVEPQLGITFGTEEGSFAEMIMDFPTVEKFEEYKTKIMEQLKTLSPELDFSKMPPIEDVDDFIVVPTKQEFDVLFKDMKIDGVIVEIMDDDDGYYIEIDLDGDDDDDDDE